MIWRHGYFLNVRREMTHHKKDLPEWSPKSVHSSIHPIRSFPTHNQNILREWKQGKVKAHIQLAIMQKRKIKRWLRDNKLIIFSDFRREHHFINQLWPFINHWTFRRKLWNRLTLPIIKETSKLKTESAKMKILQYRSQFKSEFYTHLYREHFVSEWISLALL